MTFPANQLIHEANLETGTTITTNDYGNVGTPVYTKIACLFGQSKGSYPQSESGDRDVFSPACIVPAGTVATKGKKLVGLTSPFNRTYTIEDVQPAMLPGSVSHLVLYLESVK